VVQDLPGLKEQGLGSFPKLLSRWIRNMKKRKTARPFYRHSEWTEVFIVRCPPRLYISCPLQPVRTGGNNLPKLQLFQEKRKLVLLYLRELLRSSKSKAWGLVPGFGRSLLFKATLDISRSLQTFFLTGASDLSLGEEPGNENSTERMNCVWQRQVLGEMSC